MSYTQLSRPYRLEFKPRMQTIFARMIVCNNCRPAGEKLLAGHMFFGALSVKHLDRFADVKCDFCENEICKEPAPCKCHRCK